MRRAFLTTFATCLVQTASGLAQEKPSTPTPPTAPPQKVEPKPTPPPTDIKPRELLERAADIAKRIKVVQYDAVTTTTPSGSAPTSRIKGRVMLSGWSQDRPNQFRYEVTVRRGQDGPEAQVVIGRDGSSYFVIEEDKKAVYVGAEPKYLGTYQILAKFFPVVDFVNPRPYEEEINGEMPEYRGTLKIGDEECHVVFARHVGGAQEVTWYLSTKDLLPRAIERTRLGPDGAKAQARTDISSLVVDPKIDADAFRLKLPDGFQRHTKPAP